MAVMIDTLQIDISQAKKMIADVLDEMVASPKVTEAKDGTKWIEMTDLVQLAADLRK